MSTRPLTFSPAPDDSEEIARAEIYGLLAQLFYAPPVEALYAQLQVAVTQAPARGGFLEASFGELVAASRRLTLAAVGDEYAALFHAIGKPEVFLYGSYYVAGALNEKPLVALRDELAALGLARTEGMGETEDHIAYLCEVMRYLIASDEVARATWRSSAVSSTRSCAAGSSGCSTRWRRIRRPTSTARWRCSRAISSPSRVRVSTCSTPERPAKLAVN